MVNIVFCPDCGTPLIHIEGCLVCPACGWSPCESLLYDNNGEYKYEQLFSNDILEI